MNPETRRITLRCETPTKDGYSSIEISAEIAPGDGTLISETYRMFGSLFTLAASTELRIPGEPPA